jgi:hypothetical protein
MTRNLGRTWAWMAALAVAAVLAACGPAPSPAAVASSVVRAPTPAGERVVLLTSQWKTYSVGSRSSRRAETDLLVDVWGFDANSGEPVWRTRLIEDRDGINQGMAVLGVHGDTVWVLQPDGLTALSAGDGRVLADAARIAAANPQLTGVLPTDPRYYRFDKGGLALTAGDGRAWRLGPDLKASPDAGPVEEGPAFPPARYTGGNGTWGVLDRDVRMAGGRWLGVLAESERDLIRFDGVVDYSRKEEALRRRLWISQGGGPASFAPLPESPEFLQPGLLTNGVYNAPPINLRNPDSVLVLDRTALGDDGLLQLTRISSPAGRPVWSTALPLQRIDSVLPGERTVVLVGTRREPDPGRTDGLTQDVHLLVTVDAVSGQATTYGFNILPTPGPEIPPSSVTDPVSEMR